MLTKTIFSYKFDNVKYGFSGIIIHRRLTNTYNYNIIIAEDNNMTSKDTLVQFRVPAIEKLLYKEAAELEHLELPSWARKVLFKEAKLAKHRNIYTKAKHEQPQA